MRHILLLLVWPTLTAAQPQLSLPIECTLGEDCFIQQFVDRDPGPQAADFNCGSLSYDGHKGTDFALNSLAAQAKGVNVLAAAPGIVLGVRDEMPDILRDQPDAPNLEGRECGNGVLIDHGDGWETQYCHMALGSIAVAPGQEVTTGAILGRVGLSGQTEFPHLHLSVRQNGAVIDPFDPDGDPQCGADPDESLWRTPIPTPPGGIIITGFSDQVPKFDDIKAGSAGAAQLAAEAPALVLWAYMFGSTAGDQVKLTITNPAGATFYTDTFLLERGQAQLFRAGGRRIPADKLIAGMYSGAVELLRNGETIDRQTVTVQIGIP